MKPPAKFCVCIGDIERRAALEVLKSEALCELRLDLLSEVEPLDQLLNAGSELVVTCRPNERQTDAARYALYKSAIEHPVYAVDLDIEDPLLTDLKELILISGTKLILSYHNFSDTPGAVKLNEIRESAFSAGADIFKLAAFINSRSDIIRLLSLLEDKREQIIIGMGELGKIVRLTAPYLGSLFTYVSTPNAETAPGQLETSQLKECWQILGEP